jgi:hypothetical protein
MLSFCKVIFRSRTFDLARLSWLLLPWHTLTTRTDFGHWCLSENTSRGSHPLRSPSYSLLDLYKKYTDTGVQLSSIVGRITLNLGNLHHVLYRGLEANNPDVAISIYCVIILNSFDRVTAQSHPELMERIPAVLSQLGNHMLEVQFITEFLVSPTQNVMLKRSSACERRMSFHVFVSVSYLF